MHCPCGSTKEFNQCCEPFLLGTSIPKTPEALMRSRYSAYSRANTDYIEQTMRGKAAINFDRTSAKTWASSIKWLGLNVINSSKGKSPNQGFVEFAARFEKAGEIHFIHETSEFQLIDDHWYYVDGNQHEAPGRNSVCPCGSEKKYKRCCGR